nr:MAG: ORF1 [TTV-like mini virus]
MPYWYRRPTYYRRRRFWRRKFRGPFRRKLWRRRRRTYRVRKTKKKLKYLHLKEWQPTRIRKLKITGIMPLYLTTHDRVSNNMEIYIDSIAPTHVPSGGGFSIQQYTLNGFYELFTKGRCWWTQSTKDFPLIRYTGCKIDLYRSQNSDYIFNYVNCYPMRANMETYQSCQPTILQLTKNHKIVRCKKDNNLKKPYKRIKIHPPAQFQNKWLFQKDMAGIPLLMTRCCATSLDRWFLASNAQSTTIGFTSLNPETFLLHNFQRPPTAGYIPRPGVYMFALTNGAHDWSQEKIGDIIYLGNSNHLQPGITMRELKQGTDTFDTVWTKYFSSSDYWGNIFLAKYLKQEVRLVVSNLSPSQLKQHYSSFDTPIGKTNFTLRTIPNLIECRYNPLQDRGDQNEVFITSIVSDATPIQLPTDPSLKTENLPLWLAFMGFIDFQKRQGTAQKVDVNYMVVFHTKYMSPKNLSWVIPIDNDFLNQHSEYHPDDEVTDYDRENWHPKTIFQYKTCNEIVACGPGIIKLPQNVSAEAHAKYTFYFKVGGCAADTKDIKNPEDQPKFPTPINFIQSNSLQNPETPIENYLYSFDWRRDILTPKAAERIAEYCLTEKPFSELTGINIFETETSPETTSTENQTTQEKEKEALQLLIQQHQLQQREFKRRILQLLTQLT